MTLFEDEFPTITESPIHDLQKIDAINKTEGGGVELEIRVDGPLTSDVENQQRLLAKVETYLCYINSSQYRRTYGTPSTETATVVISCAYKVDPDIEEMITRMAPWAKDNRASIRLLRTTKRPKKPAAADSGS